MAGARLAAMSLSRCTAGGATLALFDVQLEQAAKSLDAAYEGVLGARGTSARPLAEEERGKRVGSTELARVGEHHRPMAQNWVNVDAHRQDRAPERSYRGARPAGGELGDATRKIGAVSKGVERRESTANGPRNERRRP
jgi:hypothetical protein